ncbi:MET18 [Mytilus edulis]|uniref:MMS19 nucleotide excision repair protein n=1 Tax=Mytilus edulis TaxID=6550 RepID=A0A8S3TR80_MYTED|nr:MET18 [Mytilus edulis]
MVHSLLSDDLELQTSTMDTLYDLTHDAPEVVAKHIDSVIPQLLKLAKEQTSMKLRQMLPYKVQVIKGLEKALDDKKRLVRKEAVTARNEWFLLGTKEITSPAQLQSIDDFLGNLETEKTRKSAESFFLKDTKGSSATVAGKECQMVTVHLEKHNCRC